MTETQKWCLENVPVDKWISPTKLAEKYRPLLSSSWASPKLLALTKMGLLERNNQGHYRRVQGAVCP